MERIEREKLVIARMIAIYCNRHHDTAKGNLCPECKSLLEYARARLSRCPNGSHKPSCRKCPIHCYAPAQKQKIKEVMRYVGPRMIFIHPLSALRHLISELS